MFLKSSKAPSGASAPAATGARKIPFSLIGGDIVIRGDLEATADLHIDGTVEGDIRCAALVQGPDSHIKGEITAKSARIAGQVEGSISAQELIVEASARITGDISYTSISIAPGAQVAGQFTHGGASASGADLKLVSSEG